MSWTRRCSGVNAPNTGIVNSLLRDANALPQLVRHGNWGCHLHAIRPGRRWPPGWPSSPPWPFWIWSAPEN